MKEEVEEDEADRYCICRSGEIVGKFMIACDHCEDWFHGDCVDVTKTESKNIKRFYCPPCRELKPGLEIKYSSSYTTQLSDKPPKKKIKKEKDDFEPSPKRKIKEEKDSEGIRPPDMPMETEKAT